MLVAAQLVKVEPTTPLCGFSLGAGRCLGTAAGAGAARAQHRCPTHFARWVVFSMGHQLKGILALTKIAFFKILWNLTAKPTSISAPEQLSSLGVSVAMVTLF